MATTIIAVGRIEHGGDVEWRISPPALIQPVTDTELDALLDEVYGKPQLGVEGSAGLVDYEAELEDYREWLDDHDFWRTGAW